MPPAVLVDRVTVALGHRLTVAQRLRAQHVIHYGMGTALGVAYSIVASRWPRAQLAQGSLAGLAIYAGTHGSVLPALDIQRPPWRLAPATVAWELTSHLVFGAALEAALVALGAPR
jgi:uncharacterized membrane protein YagU involved in acid resistance